MKEKEDNLKSFKYLKSKLIAIWELSICSEEKYYEKSQRYFDDKWYSDQHAGLWQIGALWIGYFLKANNICKKYYTK